MDLRTNLKRGDLFVSYWLTDRLMVIIGDETDVHQVTLLPTDKLSESVAAFEAQVTQVEYYSNFISEAYRFATWPAPVQPQTPMVDILTRLGSILIPPALLDRCRSGTYKRLLIFPDGILHSIPIHLLLDHITNGAFHEIFEGGVIYAPSASSYIYCCAKRRRETPEQAAILIGKTNEFSYRWEAELVANELPCPVKIVTQANELQSISEDIDLLYIITHGASPKSSWRSDTSTRRDDIGWGLLLGDEWLDPEVFLREKIKLRRGAIVLLSACSVGRLMPGPVHELHGLIRGLFYAGAATVIAACWPIFDEMARAVFLGTIKNVFTHKQTFARGTSLAIADAVSREDLKLMMSGSESQVFFCGPFSLFGCGD